VTTPFLTSGGAGLSPLVTGFAKSCENVMKDRLRILKPVGAYVAGLAITVLVAWHGCSEIYRWYTTGALLTRFDSGTRWAHWQLITFDTYPFNFIMTFAANALIAALGLAACIAHYLIIRRWWDNKLKATGE
jgi:hypothetical protein